MTAPTWYGKNADVLPANVAGVPTRALAARRFDEGAPYVIRFSARLGGGTAAAISVAHNFYVDDGLGDGEQLHTLTTSLASGVEETSLLEITGVGQDVRVRAETVPSAAPAAERQCTVSAAIVPRCA